MSRLLIYVDTYLPLSETFVYQMHLHMQRHEVVILTHKIKNLEQFTLPNVTIELIPRRSQKPMRRILRGLFNKLKYGLESSELITLSELKPIIEKHSIELIAAHFSNNGIKILAAARVLKLPLIVMAHGCDVTSWPNIPRYNRNLQQLFKSADAFITASNYLREQVASIGCPEKNIYTNYLAPPKRLLSIPPMRTFLEGQTVTFLQSGRLVPKKGILYTIRAFAAARGKEEKLELRIIGDGELRKPAEALCMELGLQNHIHFLGAQDYSTVIEELQKADVFVLHSMTAPNGDTEGGPTLAVQEAMALGLPVISTKHADIPYVIQDGESGYLSDEGDIEGTTQAFLKLAQNPSLRLQMGQHAREQIKGLKLTAEATSERFEEIVDQCLAATNMPCSGSEDS